MADLVNNHAYLLVRYSNTVSSNIVQFAKGFLVGHWSYMVTFLCIKGIGCFTVVGLASEAEQLCGAPLTDRFVEHKSKREKQSHANKDVLVTRDRAVSHCYHRKVDYIL